MRGTQVRQPHWKGREAPRASSEAHTVSPRCQAHRRHPLGAGDHMPLPTAVAAACGRSALLLLLLLHHGCATTPRQTSTLRPGASTHHLTAAPASAVGRHGHQQRHADHATGAALRRLSATACPALSKEHLASRAVDNTVLITISDKIVFDLFGPSWIDNVQRANITYWFVSALDPETSLRLGEMGVADHCFNAPHSRLPYHGKGQSRTTGLRDRGSVLDSGVRLLCGAQPSCERAALTAT